ncbi:MAG: DUF916 and DUF3324 domain-containing protein [Turicibacter sp.]|nr:DUF916 and DUF3324 domain-containing protein [Turicibacter sp.]
MLKKRVGAILVWLAISFALLNFIETRASELNFSVETILPDNQITEGVSYFDLLLAPSETQTVQIRLTNNTDEDIVVLPVIATATTNHNGVVEFVPRDVERDSTLMYLMEEIVTVPEEVIIPANGVYLLDLDIEMPEEAFEGILAGGITLRERDEELDEMEENDEAGMTIRNLFEFVVGIVLQNDASASVQVEPDLVLREVYPTHINRRNVIIANVQNVMPNFVRSLTVDARIMREGSEEVLFYLEIDEAHMWRMAPNSNIDIPIRLEGEALEPGDYILDLRMTARHQTEDEDIEIEKVWQWREPFSITEAEATFLNSEDVTIPATFDFPWLPVLIVLLTVVFVVLLVIRLTHNKRVRQREKFDDLEKRLLEIQSRYKQ